MDRSTRWAPGRSSGAKRTTAMWWRWRGRWRGRRRRPGGDGGAEAVREGDGGGLVRRWRGRQPVLVGGGPAGSDGVEEGGRRGRAGSRQRRDRGSVVGSGGDGRGSEAGPSEAEEAEAMVKVLLGWVGVGLEMEAISRG